VLHDWPALWRVHTLTHLLPGDVLVQLSTYRRNSTEYERTAPDARDTRYSDSVWFKELRCRSCSRKRKRNQITAESGVG
jgi:hypothetical protein